MTREQSHVFTTLRGTRGGYLAPEWIPTTPYLKRVTCMYSCGIVLIEIIDGRKNFDPTPSR
ncbi:hypothetical protein HS088_TW04G00131 [Tripterygium wilfordii]|uniref:Uncharacterized protein n=1 Tax=Tripterygium wilfordii TaxID=458696 RepID=A0A7J7DPA2_TRIWF|nr:hypothetical protein HS088_TW04G00131 [Tripterygium wilfordii]